MYILNKPSILCSPVSHANNSENEMLMNLVMWSQVPYFFISYVLANGSKEYEFVLWFDLANQFVFLLKILIIPVYGHFLWIISAAQ